LRHDYRAIHAASFDEISLNGCAPIRHANIIMSCRKQVAPPARGLNISEAS
jgi:hypothetical protein